MLTKKEQEFYNYFLDIKSQSGTHSPSIFKLLKQFPEISIKIDACFLCNPYAFDLFHQELKKTDLQKYLKFYPPQNKEVAENISIFRNIPSDRILIGNGAIELIEKILNKIENKKILLPLPTFSSYYESLNDNNEVINFYLSEENKFELNVNDFIQSLNRNKPDYVVIVNPNNPTGRSISKDDLIKIHKNLSKEQFLIIDESFIDFSNQESMEKYSIDYENIIIIRSLSKDFGIAGIRVGYAIMPKYLVDDFLNKGFLWNSNGLAYFFTELLSDKNFQNSYEKAKEQYNKARDEFYSELLKLNIEVIPSSANFFMIKTPNNPEVYFTKLLYSHGIYTRILNDKLGLNGNWIRIASKDFKENRQMIHSIKKVWGL